MEKKLKKKEKKKKIKIKSTNLKKKPKTQNTATKAPTTTKPKQKTNTKKQKDPLDRIPKKKKPKNTTHQTTPSIVEKTPEPPQTHTDTTKHDTDDDVLMKDTNDPKDPKDWRYITATQSSASSSSSDESTPTPPTTPTIKKPHTTSTTTSSTSTSPSTATSTNTTPKQPEDSSADSSDSEDENKVAEKVKVIDEELYINQQTRDWAKKYLGLKNMTNSKKTKQDWTYLIKSDIGRVPFWKASKKNPLSKLAKGLKSLQWKHDFTAVPLYDEGIKIAQVDNLIVTTSNTMSKNYKIGKKNSPIAAWNNWRLNLPIFKPYL